MGEGHHPRLLQREDLLRKLSRPESLHLQESLRRPEDLLRLDSQHRLPLQMLENMHIPTTSRHEHTLEVCLIPVPLHHLGRLKTQWTMVTSQGSQARDLACLLLSWEKGLLQKENKVRLRHQAEEQFLLLPLNGIRHNGTQQEPFMLFLL